MEKRSIVALDTELKLTLSCYEDLEYLLGQLEYLQALAAYDISTMSWKLTEDTITLPLHCILRRARP